METVIIRGGGDIATGVIQKFYRAGFNVIVLETFQPTAIRRTVSLCEAVYEKEATVEGIKATLTDSRGISKCFESGVVPVVIDPDCSILNTVKPLALIDAIIAKKNTGMSRKIADITVALGPGFVAGEDVDVVIETMRGHDLGRLVFKGCAMPDTGVPGEIGGKSAERVIHAPAGGLIKNFKKIGDIVQQGEVIMNAGGIEATAPFTGLLRGLIKDGLNVRKGMKVADVDPRTDVDYFTISDKARCVGGGALEAVMYMVGKRR